MFGEGMIKGAKINLFEKEVSAGYASLLAFRIRNESIPSCDNR